MTWTPLKIIVAINVLLHLGSTLAIGASMGSTGGYGPSYGWGVLLSALFLMPVNLVLSGVTGIAAAVVKGDRRAAVGNAATGFILSVGVVLLMSVPMCMISLTHA